MRRIRAPRNDDYDPSGIHICPECGAGYSGTGGGHCRGGAYGGCCRTFTSDTAADAHRRGPGTDRHCIDVTTAKGWRNTPAGWTNGEPLPEDIY